MKKKYKMKRQVKQDKLIFVPYVGKYNDNDCPPLDGMFASRETEFSFASKNGKDKKQPKMPNFSLIWPNYSNYFDEINEK